MALLPQGVFRFFHHHPVAYLGMAVVSFLAAANLSWKGRRIDAMYLLGLAALFLIVGLLALLGIVRPW